MFSGMCKSRAYCPIDISVPDARVEAILSALPSRIILSTEPLNAKTGGKQVIDLPVLQHILQDCKITRTPEFISEKNWVHGDDTYYIIFTSGSTGTPKGVQITADCLNHYLDWSTGLGSSPQQKRGQIFLNQAPFSFDLSVMDLYTSLASGGTLYCLEKSVQSDYRELMHSLGESGVHVWVSTPSFAEICLSEQGFGEKLLPNLETFLFCGETLTNKTAARLQARFPGAYIINTYGPTESTVAVTDVRITPELTAGKESLPVGRPKPGTVIEIQDEEGNALPEGEKGEIVIIGDTVSTGYYGRPDLTEKAFFLREDPKHKTSVRGYHTGDKGWLHNGMLYYCGRIDLQIKLHGYRIELEDIENNISRLPQVQQAVVVPGMRGGKVTSLTAYIVKHPSEQPEAEEKTEKEEAARFRTALKEFLPDYMIPKKILFLKELPMTSNGKVNRKLLAEYKGEQP